ncbi:hypothetical protein QA802_21720 [Streptomyces sp. B21-105]|uniref:hypothetical protein n=1 Tax=Streptomyces sp. B21-105 TaxID=3039417 RepID=UPI002FF37EE8
MEHRWFDPDPVAGPPVAVEAGRCLRLYPRNTPLALLARGTWLPYGDLYHFTHSAHPAVRWNYLPALESSLRGPHYRPPALLLGGSAVLRRHRQALATVTADHRTQQDTRPGSSTAPAGYSADVLAGAPPGGHHEHQGRSRTRADPASRADP